MKMLQLTPPLESHDFCPELRRRMRPLLLSDNWNGPLEVAQVWLLVGLSIFASRLAFVHLPLLLSIPIFLLAIVLIGSRQRTLINIVHSSSHRSLALNSKLNLFLGTVVSGWPVLVSWTGYHYQHVVLHHPHLGDLDRDPDLVQILQTGLYEEGVTREDVLQYLKAIPTPKETLRFLRYVLEDRIWPKHQDPKENVLRCLFGTTVFSAVVGSGLTLPFLAYWLLPLITTCVWMSSLVEFLEHYPLMALRNAPGVFLSRNRFLGGVADFLLSSHFDGYHLVHHLFPRIPAWNTPKAHRVLMEDEVYRKANSLPIGLSPLIEDILNKIQ